MFTLRAGAVVGFAVGGARCGDAVADGDLLGSDDDVFDDEPEGALTFIDAGVGGAVA